ATRATTMASPRAQNSHATASLVARRVAGACGRAALVTAGTRSVWVLIGGSRQVVEHLCPDRPIRCGTGASAPGRVTGAVRAAAAVPGRPGAVFVVVA